MIWPWHSFPTAFLSTSSHIPLNTYILQSSATHSHLQLVHMPYTCLEHSPLHHWPLLHASNCTKSSVHRHLLEIFTDTPPVLGLFLWVHSSSTPLITPRTTHVYLNWLFAFLAPPRRAETIFVLFTAIPPTVQHICLALKRCSRNIFWNNERKNTGKFPSTMTSRKMVMNTISNIMVQSHTEPHLSSGNPIQNSGPANSEGNGVTALVWRCLYDTPFPPPQWYWSVPTQCLVFILTQASLPTPNAGRKGIPPYPAHWNLIFNHRASD